MNKKTLPILAALICMASLSKAQYIEDAMRFSQTELGSTARFKAIGNASTSLGGDLSSITGNPAGLGFFNTSDAGFSLNYSNNNNNSKYYGTSSSAQVEKFNFDQAGIVFNMPNRHNAYRQSGWLNFNVGIGYAKTNDFNSTIHFEGENNNSSYTNFLTEATDPVFEDWGVNSWLLEVDPSDRYYTSASESLTNDQKNNDKRTGSQYQTNFSFGANYNNQFYIGASVGITGFSYRSERRFDEFGDTKSASEFLAINSGSNFLKPENAGLLSAPYTLSLTSSQKTNGTGFNGTVGMIYRPDNMFQIGFSATSPTWYVVTDDYNMYFDSWIDPTDGTETAEYHPNEEVYYEEYNLRTPYRLNAGVSAKFEDGLISADIEYVDYTSMRVTTNSPANDSQSADIVSSEYKGAANFRVGGEYRLTPAFLLRAGFNYQGNPYQHITSTKQTVSGGLGYRISNIYVDLTYLNSRQDLTYTPYQSTTFPADPATVKNSRDNIFLTLGLKF